MLRVMRYRPEGRNTMPSPLFACAWWTAPWIAAVSSVRPSPAPLTTTVLGSSGSLVITDMVDAAAIDGSDVKAIAIPSILALRILLSNSVSRARCHSGEADAPGLLGAIAGGAAQDCHDQGRIGSACRTWMSARQ